MKQQPSEVLSVNGREIPVALVRNRRARRYVLRLRADGVARLTVPRHGSTAEAWQFALRNGAWLERQLQYYAAHPVRPKEWLAGAEIFFRGRPTRIETAANGNGNVVQLENELIHVALADGDLRPAIEKHLRALATAELPARVQEFA